MKTIIRATTVSQSLSFFDGTMADLIKDYDVQLLSSPGEQLDLMGKKYGVKTHPVEMYRRMSPFKDLKSLWQLIRVFRKEKACMVHSMTPKAGLLCMMAAWLTRVPIRLHTFTGLVWPTENGFRRKLLMFTDKITCACATHIIPEGEGVKNDLITGKITKKPLKVLGYGNVRGVDMDYYSRTEEVMQVADDIRDSQKFTFLFVGRIVRDKGINELVEAFVKLYSENPNCRLILVGPYEDNLDPVSQETREAIAANPDIMAVGRESGVELLAYYAASDCFVMPSYREGFPNTVLEAGAMGLPSIVTDINGSREIIVQGENGIIVPSQDAQALLDAMSRMVRDTEQREHMAGNARKMVADRFEQGFVRRCLYEFYEEILGMVK